MIRADIVAHVRRMSGAWPYLVASCAAIGAHASALAGGFVWLDHAHLEEGLALAPLGELHTLFARGFAGTGYYRPLMAVSLSIDAAASGLSAVWLHAVTLAWHALAAAATVYAARTLGLSRRAAAIAGLAFAVHPLGSLVAGAIAFRSEAMVTAALLGLVAFHQRRRALAAAVALAVAGLTKETGLALAPLFVVTLELLERPVGPRRRLLLAEAAAFVAALSLRVAYAPAFRARPPDLTFGEAVGTRLASLGKSALAVVAPAERTICDAFAVAGPVSVRALVGLGVAVGLGWLALRRRGPAMLLALSILPSLQLVPVMRWWSPHYLYLPLAFAAMLLGEALDQLAARPRLARPLTMAVGAGAACLAWLSFVDGRRFHHDGSLWGPEVAADAACREGQFFLGRWLHERGRSPEAAEAFARAVVEPRGILSYVDRGAALQNLGVARLALGQFVDARAALEAALGLADERERREILHNLAAVELGAGRADAALGRLAPELDRPDAQPASLFLAARALHELGRDGEAGALLRRLRR